MRAAHDMVYVFVGGGVKLAFIPDGEQLREAGHCADGLLQIVRGDQGELFEILIRTRQFVGHTPPFEHVIANFVLTLTRP